MKKIFLLLTITALLNSCGCYISLSQVPPQYIFPDVNCTAILPDYKPFVVVSAGCTGFTLTQTPTPGTLLTLTNMTANVIIKAVGANGKSSQIQFNVSMKDTITPKITPIGTLAEYRLEQAKELYTAGDEITEKVYDMLYPGEKTNILVHYSFPDSLGIREIHAMYVDSLTIPIWKR